MEDTRTAGRALASYAAAIARRDWAALRGLLADDATVVLLHTGERFGPDRFVALNRDYPGAWDFELDEVVDGGGRGAVRAHTSVDGRTYHVATFASLDPNDRLTDLVEVWTDAVAPHPARGGP